MIKSLRWRMRIWFTGLLLAVVGAFGGILYHQTWTSRLREVDAQLENGALYLDAILRGFPSFEVDGKSPPPPKGKPGPPKNKKPGPGPPGGPRERLIHDLVLPRALDALPGGDKEDEAYFCVWRADGSMLKSRGVPGDAHASEPHDLSPRPVIRQRGPFREAWQRGPHFTTILVGRSMHRERSDRHAFGLQLAIVGLAVVAVGSLLVLLLSRRMVRPLAAMSAAAAGISEANLGDRLEARDMDAELASLAGVLNETFARLDAAFQRQAQFTADASHELRTPLAILRSHAELALSRPRSEEEYRQALDAILRASARMGHLVQGLLTLARADGNNLAFRRHVVALDALAADAVDLMRPLAAQHSIRLTADLAPVQVLGDADGLGQVLTNLLQNSIQYNREGGTVHVTLEAAEGKAILSVVDSGLGIPQKDQPHIFERFFRVDKARSRASGGAGLGLAICDTIIRSHGGGIAFQSIEGKETCFRIELPISPALP